MKKLILVAVVFLWSSIPSVAEVTLSQVFSESDGMNRMLAAIETSTRMTTAYTGVKAISQEVMTAMAKVDRAQFVPKHSVHDAFENQPLRIGYGQTISQPFIVALMLHLLQLQPDDRVLEVGTGSGYQAAVTAELAAHVHTIEIIPELARSADRRLKSLGYTNISVRTGDGWYGWPEEAPFDGILVTAVAQEVPPWLLAQLAVGGRLVMPVGEVWGDQELVLLTRDTTGVINTREVLPVRFVPMTGEGILTLRDSRQHQ